MPYILNYPQSLLIMTNSGLMSDLSHYGLCCISWTIVSIGLDTDFHNQHLLLSSYIYFSCPVQHFLNVPSRMTLMCVSVLVSSPPPHSPSPLPLLSLNPPLSPLLSPHRTPPQSYWRPSLFNWSQCGCWTSSMTPVHLSSDLLPRWPSTSSLTTAHKESLSWSRGPSRCQKGTPTSLWGCWGRLERLVMCLCLCPLSLQQPPLMWTSASKTL